MKREISRGIIYIITQIEQMSKKLQCQITPYDNKVFFQILYQCLCLRLLYLGFKILNIKESRYLLIKKHVNIKAN